ncbi:hypothetical protein Ssi03_13300 [Sphaerisporangium siamense]|uniref:Uncharacterized protein n=1 Tax=Sphaerisporangium siamense TaxID=795645 RepID=A0A7W7D9T3_9ACTN|nr:hypothetical protein [Sphaerisporangium siamense]MBB4702902.1 hypothetical protein [Sphaerisporangium siamense]GII83340.1 hypothetical protein Ssi03_13300 [Sphaerisporangium siamense]
MPSPDYCYSCGRDEPVPPSGVYIICIECGHVYETADDLLHLYNEQIIAENRAHPEWAMPLAIDPDNIGCCALCLHDL